MSGARHVRSDTTAKVGPVGARHFRAHYSNAGWLQFWSETQV